MDRPGLRGVEETPRREWAVSPPRPPFTSIMPAPRAGQENTMNRERVVSVVVLAAAGLLVGGPAKAAPTLISSLPYTISQPGAYEVATNLTTGALGDAILITANNVTLTVGGH